MPASLAWLGRRAGDPTRNPRFDGLCTSKRGGFCVRLGGNAPIGMRDGLEQPGRIDVRASAVIRPCSHVCVCSRVSVLSGVSDDFSIDVVRNHLDYGEGGAFDLVGLECRERTE